MKKRLFKVVLVILIILLLKEIILVSVLNHNNKESVKAYFRNDTSFNYKSNFVINIPKIKIETVIKKADFNFKNLNNSLVYYKYDDYKGKIIIFGHSGVGRGVYFNRLDELDINDYLYLYKDKLKITYIVSKKYSVPDTDISILENNSKETLLLVTCDKNNKNIRLVVELVINSIKTLKK